MDDMKMAKNRMPKAQELDDSQMDQVTGGGFITSLFDNVMKSATAALNEAAEVSDTNMAEKIAQLLNHENK